MKISTQLEAVWIIEGLVLLRGVSLIVLGHMQIGDVKNHTMPF